MSNLTRSLLVLVLIPAGAAYGSPGQVQGPLMTSEADSPAVPPPPERGPGPGPGPGPHHGGKHGPRGENGPREDDLQPITVTGKIQGFATEPHGRVDGILFVDGTNARAGRKARLEALGLKVGDTITVSGKGGSYPQGRSLHIETIKLPTGQVRTIDAPRATLTAVSRDGDIARVLINPHGDVDGLLLKDGFLVRLRPTPTSSRLVVGTKIRAEGEGTTTFVHADKVTMTASGTVLDLSSFPPAGPAPRALTTLEASSSVLQVVNNPEGEPDTLVLQDGSIVKLPPRLREDADGSIKVGAKVAVQGEGGTYGAVKALRANRLQLASGQTFSEPERPSPPPPPQNVAP
jgi:hypothetical protein